jgi:hypothetical protein
MTPEEFTAALTRLGWSQRYLAQLLSCDTNLPTRWARGVAPIPAAISKWLRQTVLCVERHPVPDDWRVR